MDVKYRMVRAVLTYNVCRSSSWISASLKQPNYCVLMMATVSRLWYSGLRLLFSLTAITTDDFHPMAGCRDSLRPSDNRETHEVEAECLRMEPVTSHIEEDNPWQRC